MSAALDLRSKEEKDAELDKRIEALRKKNEALIKRYQEIEEDRKKAEQEGIAVTALRRVRPVDAEPERRWVDKDLSITVQVMLSPGVSGGSWGSGQGGGPFGRGWRSRGRGAAGMVMGGDAGPDRKSKEWEERRRQNIKKMNEEMEKIAEYERNQRDGLHEKNPVRNFLDDPCRSGPFQDADRKEGSRRHVRNWGGTDFHKVKAGMEREKTWQGPVPGGPLDMTLSMTGRERAEYIRWKKEREQIDQERLARHRKPTGQWRREWDAEKSDSMFKEGSARPPPKPLTFGEFLTPHCTQRRRKGRGCGQGAGTKPYRLVGSHSNEDLVGWGSSLSPIFPWIFSEPLGSSFPLYGALPEPPCSLSPEEDEDQWEDVSEEEEEEGGGGGTSPGSSSEDEAPCSAVAPKLHVPPTTVAPVPDGGAGTPLSPFSPVEGHQPISDWGEEMDLASPRSSLGDSPLSGPTVPKSRGDSGETPEVAPGMVEIADFERVCFRKNSPSPAGR
uniref:Coiled-coil domain containing 9 n=1 Tax=Aquila chrysaetos chrysaetos TaxID=223781 RepID=A0A663FGW3_AQUCH